MRRVILVICILAGALLVGPGPAHAVCATDPEARSFRHMVVSRDTGNDRYPLMILGKAIAIRDLRGPAGGATIARIAVAATPLGRAPLISRVRFYRPERGTSLSDNFEFHRGHWYGVIARHRAAGGFAFDGACGRTRSMSRHFIRRLTRLADN